MLNPKKDWLQYQINSLKNKINNDVTSHDKLTNLDYESSGHTGFASEFALTKLKEETVPKRLTDFSIAKGSSKTQYVYVDNNGQDGKLSIKDINSKVLRTVNSVPDDMEDGEYIFLKI